MTDPVITQEGEAHMLRCIVSHGPLVLRLYVNDRTPTRGHSTGAFKELSKGGYTGAATLDPTLWTVEGDPAEAVYPVVRFRFTGVTGRIVGYYYEQDGVVLWAQRLPDEAPFYGFAGAELRITPRLRFAPTEP